MNTRINKVALCLLLMVVAVVSFGQTGTFKTFTGGTQVSTETVDLSIPTQVPDEPSFTLVNSLKYQLNGFDALTATGTNMFAGGSGNSTTTGVYNQGFGLPDFPALNNGPLWKLTTGSYNLAMGHYALLNITTGSGNIAAGTGAGQTLMAGEYSVLLGHEAGYGMTESYNVALGMQALRNNTYGSNNVGVGRLAGAKIAAGTSLAICNNGVFLGRDTKALEDDSTNEIVIGYDAIGAGDNTVTLGSDSVVLTKLNGYVGIGQGSTPVKMKVLTGTTNASDGASVSVAHGLSLSQIIDFSVVVDMTTFKLPLAYTKDAGYLVNAYADATTITVLNVSAGSALSKPFTVMIWYKE